jgi:FkbM family methyltransferase
MYLQHFAVKNVNKKQLAWYGYKREGCPETIIKQTRREKEIAHDHGLLYSERDCEVDCFLSVLSWVNKDSLTLLDLGTGWGEWPLALGGTIKNKLIETKVKDYFALAVECDKSFFDYAYGNYLLNGIKGRVLYGAVGKEDGKTRVNVGNISKKCCGSSLSFAGYFSDSKLFARLSGMYHYLTNQTDEVEMFCIDTLVEKYLPKKWVDFIVMDVQGTEILALEGAGKTLGKANYLMIGTHGDSVHEKVKSMLVDRFDFIVDAKPNGVTTINQDYKVICQKGQDGILLCKSRT